MVLDETMLTRFIDFLAERPTAQQILDFKANPEEEFRFNRLANLPEKYRTPDEEVEIRELRRASHIVAMIKIKAYSELNEKDEQ